MNQLQTPLVVANWKMNGNRELCRQFSTTLHPPANGEIWIAPPTVYLAKFITDDALGSFVKFGVQNVHGKTNGAYTGEVSAAMVEEQGGIFAIVGHSERRAQHGESNSFIAEKFCACLEAKLIPILCVGETLIDREAGKTQSIIESQLVEVLESCRKERSWRAVVAYEPVWAIGTGKAASPATVEEVHIYIREILAKYMNKFVPILYGGSVNEDNVGSLWEQPNIDGFLIGGASLDPHTLNSINSEISR